MILIVADTNIFINAIFSNRYRSDERIISLEENSKIKFAFSAVTKNEIYKIIARTVEIHSIISRSAIIEVPPKLEKLSSDKGDQPFIELANAVQADYLVTNDYQNGLLDIKTYNSVKVLTSSSFIKDYERMNRKKKVKE